MPTASVLYIKRTPALGGSVREVYVILNEAATPIKCISSIY